MPAALRTIEAGPLDIAYDESGLEFGMALHSRPRFPV